MYRKTFVIGVFASLVLLLLLSTPLSAIESEALVKEAEEAFSCINDIQTEQELTSYEGDEEVTFDIYIAAKGDKYRMEMILPEDRLPPNMRGQKAVIVTLFNGEEYWMKSPFQGKKKIETEEEAQSQYLMLTPYMNWWKIPHDEPVKEIRTEKVDGRDCYVIELESEESKIWVDKETMVAVKSTSKSNGKTSEMAFSDFKTIDGGLEFPHKMVIKEDNETQIILKINSFKLNKGVSEDLFNPEKL